MLRFTGSPRRLCDGWSRRDLLRAGGLSGAGLSLSHLLSSEAAARPVNPVASFGKAKNCILLFLYGAHSQLETFDMKPEAPLEVRGEMQPIASSLPGLDVVELLPRTARVMDRTTVVRSVTHPYPIHGVAFATTGVTAVDVGMELSPNDPRHQPYFGSCVEYVDRERRGGRTHEFVQNVALPFPFSSRRTDQPFRAGPYPAYLGNGYQPIWTDFRGDGTTVVRKERAGGFAFEGPEPYIGCTRDSHFRLSSVNALEEVTASRMARRRDLLAQFDSTRADLERAAAGSTLSTFQEMAWSLLGSERVRDALDVRNEPDAVRDSYGMTLFGQSCLAARRLIESGTRLTSVFWDEYGLAGDAWDTHFNHFPRMKEQLLPGLDWALSGLISDLDDRGMLDETLVVLLSEHGRTPKINSAAGGGRDHWSRAYSLMLAGGGIARGRVVGATDAIAGDVIENPISPKSVLATMYHLLGIDPHTKIEDADGHPTPLVPENAHVLPELLA